MAELVSTVNAVLQQVGFDAVSRLRKGLEMAHSSVYVLCSVALTRILGVADMIFRYKGGKSRDEKEAEPSEGRLVEGRQCSAKATRLRGSSKGRSARL